MQMPDQFSVILGADSLNHRRSGVGRETFEIARALRQGVPEVRQAVLLFGTRVQPLDHLDVILRQDAQPDAAAAGPAGPAAAAPAMAAPMAAPMAAKARPGLRARIGGVPGVQPLRRLLRRDGMARATRALCAASAGRLVYHEPNMIAVPWRGATVVTINDLSWHREPAWHPADRLRWIERNLPRSLAQARRFVAISAFTKAEAVAALGLPAERIDVVHLAPAEEFRPMTAEQAAPALARHGLTDRGYVLSVSTLEPRKNFDRLLAAHRRLPPALRARLPLVIAGGKGWGAVLARPEAEQAARAGELRLLGHVPDQDLAALTARAGVFAYVSLYEGFGLPVVEAMAAGAAVLASGTSSVGEVAGEAALLVDPLDEDAIIEGLRRLAEDTALADRLRAAGLARAADFSWQHTLRGLVGCWQKALG